MKFECGDPDFDLATRINHQHMEAMADHLPLDIQRVAEWINALRAPGLKAIVKLVEIEELVEELHARLTAVEPR